MRIVYSFSKPQGPDSPVTVIDAKFSNANPAPLDNFALLVSLPRYLEKEITAASAAAVPPNNSGVVTQRLKITNTQHKVVRDALRAPGACCSRGRVLCPAMGLTQRGVVAETVVDADHGELHAERPAGFAAAHVPCLPRRVVVRVHVVACECMRVAAGV